MKHWTNDPDTMKSGAIVLQYCTPILYSDLWMSSCRLSLNSSKTQLIWFGTPQQFLKLHYNLLSEKFPHFTFSSSVRDLGVTLDSSLPSLNTYPSLPALLTSNLGVLELFADLFHPLPSPQLSMLLSVLELTIVILSLLAYPRFVYLLFNLY